MAGHHDCVSPGQRIEAAPGRPITSTPNTLNHDLAAPCVTQNLMSCDQLSVSAGQDIVMCNRRSPAPGRDSSIASSVVMRVAGAVILSVAARSA